MQGIPRFRDVVVQALGADKAARFFNASSLPPDEMQELSQELERCYPDAVSSTPPLAVKYLDGATDTVQVVLFEETDEDEALVLDQKGRAYRMQLKGELPTLEPFCIRHAINHGFQRPPKTNH